MHKTPEDHDRITRIAQGDEAALADLAAAYHARLWRYLARRMDGDTERIEDLLQELWLTVWRKAHTFRGEARSSTWIFQIARHLAENARIAQGRRVEGHTDPAGADALLILPAPDLEAAVLTRLDLAAALRQLAPKHQEALDLVCYHGFTIDEAARILNVPPGTVKSRLSYARRALLAALDSGATL